MYCMVVHVCACADIPQCIEHSARACHDQAQVLPPYIFTKYDHLCGCVDDGQRVQALVIIGYAAFKAFCSCLGLPDP